jgi:hypothetical protein
MRSLSYWLNKTLESNMSQLGFITRIPGTLKLVTQVITQALQWDTWHRMAETTRYHLNVSRKCQQRYTYCMVLRNFFGGKHLRVRWW